MTKILKICSKIGLIIAMMITVYSVSPSSEIQAIPEEVFFTVTYDSQGGTAFDPVQVKKGDPIGQLPVPVKDGFG
ncbi:MAG: InlB B-repeat-containing protein, partial [Erysipelothrix sp.]|nr:InlB B-repeat-containing protein [Erysipelothrix sp.]